MPIIVFANRKGGVAKTTNSVAIARCFAANGKNVLFIDADSQCNSSCVLSDENLVAKREGQKKTLYDLLCLMLKGGLTPQQYQQFIFQTTGNDTSNLQLIQSSMRMDDFQTNRAKARQGYATQGDFISMWTNERTRFQRWLSANYHYVIIDFPCTFELQVLFFLAISDYYIIPCTPSKLPIHGAKMFCERLIGKSFTNIKPLGLLWGCVRSVADHRSIINESQNGRAPFDKLPKPFIAEIPEAIEIQRSTDPMISNSSFNSIYPTKHKLYYNLCLEIDSRIDAQRNKNKVHKWNGRDVEIIKTKLSTEEMNDEVARLGERAACWQTKDAKWTVAKYLNP